MEEFRKRYEALSFYVRGHHLIRLDKFWTALPESPNEGQLKTLEEKLKKAEEKQKTEVDPCMPILLEKRRLWQSLIQDPLFDEEKLDPGFKRSYIAVKTKMSNYEWNDQDILVKGTPVLKNNVELIKVENLVEMWDKKRPRPMPADKAVFDGYRSKAEAAFNANLPHICKAPQAAEALEKLKPMFLEAQAKVDAGETIDLRQIENLALEVWKVVPIEAANKKKKAKDSSSPHKCQGKECSEPALWGNFCYDCYADQWQKTKKDVTTRETHWRRKASENAKSDYRYTIQDAFHEAYHKMQKDHGKTTNYAKAQEMAAALEKSYLPIDEFLPKMGTFKVSPLETQEVVDSEEEEEEIEEEVESSEEEEEDSEEEEEEEEEDYKPKKPKKRNREEEDEVSMGDLLSTFSTLHPHIQELSEAYRDGMLAQTFKKLKEATKERFEVIIYKKDTGEALPWIPDPTIFYSHKEAEARAESLLDEPKIRDAGFVYRIDVIKPK